MMQVNEKRLKQYIKNFYPYLADDIYCEVCPYENNCHYRTDESYIYDGIDFEICLTKILEFLKEND